MPITKTIIKRVWFTLLIFTLIPLIMLTFVWAGNADNESFNILEHF